MGTKPAFEAGEVYEMNGRRYKVLGPAELKPWVDGDTGERYEVWELPVAHIPPSEPVPNGGQWVHESCFDYMTLVESPGAGT